MFSVRHEFASAWAKFKNETATDGFFELSINLLAEHFPYASKACIAVAKSMNMDIDILARSSDDKKVPEPIKVKVDDRFKETLSQDANLGNLFVGKLKIDLSPDQVLKLYFDTNKMADLWLAVTWKP